MGSTHDSGAASTSPKSQLWLTFPSLPGWGSASNTPSSTSGSTSDQCQQLSEFYACAPNVELAPNTGIYSDLDQCSKQGLGAAECKSVPVPGLVLAQEFKCQCRKGFCKNADGKCVPEADKNSRSANVGITIYPDGYHPIVTMQYPQDGFATEMLFQYDLDANGITVNATHAIFPKHKQVQANFITRQHGNNKENVGVVTARYFHQTGSMFSTDTVVGIGERMMAFWRNDEDEMNTSSSYTDSFVGGTDGDSADALSLLEETVGAQVSSLLNLKNGTRDYLVSLASLISRPGMQALQAPGMPNVDTHNFASDGKPLPQSMLDRADEARTLMAQRFAALDDSAYEKPVWSATNCFHWNAPNAGWTEDSVVFKLNTKIEAYRGQTVAAPWTSFGALQGTSYFTVHDGKLEVFYGTSVHAQFPDPWTVGQGEEYGKIWYGSADGKSSSPPVTIQPNTRGGKSLGLKSSITGATGHNQINQVLYHDIVQKFPNDYTALWDSSGCTKPVVDFLSSADTISSLSTTIGVILADYYDPSIDPGNGMKLLKAAHFLAEYMDKLQYCGNAFLQPAEVFKGHAQYDLYMANALGHAALEYPVTSQVAGLGSTSWAQYDIAQVKSVAGQ